MHWLRTQTQLQELWVEEVDVGCCGKKPSVCADRVSGCYYTDIIMIIIIIQNLVKVSLH